MRGAAKAIGTSVVMVCGLLPRPALAVAPQSTSTATPAEAPPTSPLDSTAPDDPGTPPHGDPLAPETTPADPTDATTQPESVPEPEPIAVPEPEPAPEPVQPSPAPEPAVSTGAAPFPAAAPDDGQPERSKRALGLGLLVAGSGFVVIGATTAGLYGATQKGCGGSCIGGAIAAAAGIAGVVVGAIVLSRSRRDVALRSGARVVARWNPGHGLAF